MSLFVFVVLTSLFFRFHLQVECITYNVYVSLTYCIKYDILQAPPCWDKWQNFLPFYDWVVFHCVYVYHKFFICSSAGGLLGCSHILALINNATMNTGVHASLWTSVIFFGYIPSYGIAHRSHCCSIFFFLVVLFLVSWGNSMLFSTVAAPI